MLRGVKKAYPQADITVALSGTCDNRVFINILFSYFIPFTGLTNTYSSYVTTFEEYQKQR